MYKYCIFIIVMVLSLSGCSQSMGNSSESASSSITSKTLETLSESSTNTPTESQNDTERSASSSAINVSFRPNIDGIREIMSLKKEQVISKLGNDYETVDVGDGEQGNGLSYGKYGMTIVFDNSLAPDMIDYIICDKETDIKGAKLGMTFSEIEKILGEGKSSEDEPIEPNQPKYILTYKIDNFIIWFGAKGKNKATTDLQIRRDYMDDTAATTN